MQIKIIGTFVLAGLVAVAASGATVWIEAEDFAEKGDWKVDTQFTHTMGSAYLLCPGRNRPTERPATTTVTVPEAGAWTAWVRTRDWLPEFSPGKFALVVDGCESSVLGASKRSDWRWEKAGVFTLKAGPCALALKDLSGAYARCDAVVLTTDGGFAPPEDAAALERERARLSGKSLDVREGGTFDVVVVGSGPGGMGASLGAARNGARVALVFDRPVAGGNASTECGIGFDGASLGHPNARESGVVEEIRLTKVYRQTSQTAAFEEMAGKTPSLGLFRNERVLRVEKEGPAIAAVLSRNTLTGAWTRWRGRFFVDSTGDGWVAHFAGARTMYGREAGAEYGEEWIAPKVADRLTMSGKVSWGGGWDTKRPVAYETPVWARVMPKGFDRKVLTPDAPWWLEAPGRFDDLDDPETARDHMIRIDFAYWGWLKNEWAKKDTIANWQMIVPSGFNGRREGMRVVGDYILTANDCRAGRMFDDRVSYGGWSLDTHDPLGMDNPHGDGWWHPHMGVPIYSVPYRSLYSADIPNLFLGSRCESMTHIALGSMRVQGTQMAVGQAVGTAAALCLKYGLDARGLGKSRIAELQQQLLKDDQYIPNLRNADPLDLARTATARATSCANGDLQEDDGALRAATGAAHEIHLARGVSFLWNTTNLLAGVKCVLESGLDREVELKARFIGVESASASPDGGVVLADCTGVVPPKSRGLVPFRLSAPIAVAKPFVWVVLSPCPGVTWRLRGQVRGVGVRAWRQGDAWQVVPGQQYALETDPVRHEAVDTSPECVLDGVARPVDGCVHGWVSSSSSPLPQALTLTFEKPVSVGEVRLAFDSDLTPMRVKGRMPPKLVKTYVLEGLVDGRWVSLAEERENFLRHRVHRFPARNLTALRVRVDATWGDPSARIFEIRAYAGGRDLIETPVEIGDRLEVFWDDAIVDRAATTAERRVHQPEFAGVVMKHDAPWEGDGSDFHNILEDADEKGPLYRLYYLGWHFADQAPPKNRRYSGSFAIRVCYAESRDGIVWTKPDLGLHAFEGSTANNILLDAKQFGFGFDNFMVFKDGNPACSPDARYKAVARIAGAFGGDTGKGPGLGCFLSPDGLHFRPGWLLTRAGAFDSLNLAFWDATRGEYHCYFRGFHRVEAERNGDLNVRDIRHMVSKDFRVWSEPKTIDFRGPTGEVGEDYPLYTNVVQPYPRAPHLFVGFPSRYVERKAWTPTFDRLPGVENRRYRSGKTPRHGLTVTDCVFMMTRDGQRFHREDDAFMRPGPENPLNWVYGDCYPSWGLPRVAARRPGGDPELAFYTFEGHWSGGSENMLRWALRQDGFVSRHASYAGAKVVTKPLVFDGDEMLLNFATSARGRIFVTLREVATGRELKSCEIFGDKVDRPIDFVGGSPAQFRGRPVTLAFDMSDADVYSFRFRKSSGL